ncbi:uncharacterized protein [Ptychodera flava]|uniref:uncharacterized protein n=1 Tax=Ptychodera flava TaxID=63121 RepID=UPI00396A97B4
MQPEMSSSMNGKQWYYYNKMKRLEQRKVHLKNHINTLTEHLMNNSTPTGLRIKLHPNVSKATNSFYNRWNNTLKRTQRTCVKLIISEHKRTCNMINKDLANLNGEARTKLSTSENKELRKNMNIWIDKITKARERKQLKKCRHFSRTKRNNRHSGHPTKKIEAKEQPDPTTVINISSTSLTPAQLKILSKGLGFCPKPKQVNKLKLKTDIQEFKRRCRLQYKFREENSDPDNNLDNNVKQGPFTKEKSHYNPPPNENLTLEAFLSAVEQDIVNEDNWRQTYDNIDPDERLAIKQLRNNNAITIKAAGKGNGIVVMDTQDYINKCLEHLNNTNYYQTLDQDPTEIYTKELQTKIRRWLQKNWITNDTAKKLFPQRTICGTFLWAPKSS